MTSLVMASVCLGHTYLWIMYLVLLPGHEDFLLSEFLNSGKIPLLKTNLKLTESPNCQEV